jgi:integrase
MASQPPDRSRPATPWRPAKVHVYGVYKNQRKTRARPEQTSNRQRASAVRYDVRFHVDGHNFSRGFDKKGWADTFAEKLQEHFLAGYLFDPGARSFALPDANTDTALTVFEFITDYVRRRWTTWEPSTRRNFQRDLARAVLHLVDPDAPTLDGPQRVEADTYLRRAALIVPAPTELTEADTHWEAWFTRWSLPLTAVTDGHLQDFLEAVRTTKVDGSPRLLAPTTVAAARTPVRAAFRSAHKRRLIDWNPWEGVEWEVPTGEDDLRAELVMDPRQVLDMSAACGAIDPRYECFVLIQGACGLRLGEARELRRRDIDLKSRPATVTVRGQHSELPERFFSDGETRRRPLKGRGHRTTRKIPIPAPLAPRFTAHLAQFVERKPDALVFTTPTGRRIHTSNFHRSVWKTAREQVFEEDSPLREVRRHDLRHSAVTAWLNSGVLLKTAQKWSGHRTASVLLNTYLGVMRDDAAVSLARTEATFEAALQDSDSSQARRRAHGQKGDREESSGDE